MSINKDISGGTASQRGPSPQLFDGPMGEIGTRSSEERKKMGEQVNQAAGPTAFLVTIDGPAASGKSSVSREIARRFGWSWVSTGAFYRGLAFVAHKKNIDLSDEDALEQLALSQDWSVRLTPAQTHVFMGAVDVTDEIAREEIGGLASKVSSLPKVRRALLNAQRRCAEGVSGLVAEGRDCGTVVFPSADVKVYLTARAEDRAARRARDEGRDVEQMISEQKVRDAQDANRKAAPMQASAEAFVVDTTDYGLLEVVEKVEELVRARLDSRLQPAPRS
jgi:cytidylate kinase